MNTIVFKPSNYYVSLSVTGTYCELKCPFCKGKYLAGMINVSNPKFLLKILDYHYKHGARGFLISGGFNRNGYLMIRNEHLKVIKDFKKDHNVIFSIHPGLIPDDLLELIWSSEVDFIDLEIPPNNKYLRMIKRLKSHTINEYFKLMDKALTYSKNFVVPHVILNSIASGIDDELSIIETIANFRPRLIVTLIEIRDRMSNYIDVDRVIKVLRKAKKLFNEVSLGCMRPYEFKTKYDEIIIKEELVSRIVNPKPTIIKRFNLKVIGACCGIDKSHFKLFPILKQ